jgi:two-component system, NarL family, sensor histidine kinase BarA
MLRSVSLANKCLIVFGLALVVIILAALSVPWWRMNQLVDQGEIQAAREMIATWEAAERRVSRGSSGQPVANRPGLLPADRLAVSETTIVVLDRAGMESLGSTARSGGMDEETTRFARQAWADLAAGKGGPLAEVFQVTRSLLTRRYQMAKGLRGADGGIESMVLLERQASEPASVMLANTGFLLSAGLVALAVAVGLFYVLTNRIILSPVRRLRETAELVQQGQIDQRSDIHTGDEFEELAEAFNLMLQGLQQKQEQLRALNAAMDDKLTELGQRNQTLYESNRVKSEFLANVTHELRTPLNSIIGFAELMDEQATRELEAGDDSTRLQKRRRYVDNILGAGRALLELINGLLETAKIEAGKVELNITSCNVRELSETMLAMVRPLADKRGVTMKFEVIPEGEEIPNIKTDTSKLQQILYNLLSNAIKFTADAADHRASQMAQMDPEAAEQLSRLATVTMRVEKLAGRTGGGDDQAGSYMRVSVLDTGPGIKQEDLSKIFEKFTQLDSGYQRKHAGTGLGLSIVKELSNLLQAEVQVQSEVGRGSMFSIILPPKVDSARLAEYRLEQSLRANLTAMKSG